MGGNLGLVWDDLDDARSVEKNYSLLGQLVLENMDGLRLGMVAFVGCRKDGGCSPLLQSSPYGIGERGVQISLTAEHHSLTEFISSFAALYL